jgi:hypothetical protein
MGEKWRASSIIFPDTFRWAFQPTLEGWLFFDYSSLKVILRGFFIRIKTELLESLLPRLIKKIANSSNVGYQSLRRFLYNP